MVHDPNDRRVKPCCYSKPSTRSHLLRCSRRAEFCGRFGGDEIIRTGGEIACNVIEVERGSSLDHRDRRSLALERREAVNRYSSALNCYTVLGLDMDAQAGFSADVIAGDLRWQPRARGADAKSLYSSQTGKRLGGTRTLGNCLV